MENRIIDGKTTIDAKVREFIVQNFLFGKDPLQMKETDSFIKKGILDSTGILELIEFLESTFGIAIEESDMIPQNLDSFASVTKYVSRKIKTN